MTEKLTTKKTLLGITAGLGIAYGALSAYHLMQTWVWEREYQSLSQVRESYTQPHRVAKILPKGVTEAEAELDSIIMTLRGYILQSEAIERADDLRQYHRNRILFPFR